MNQPTAEGQRPMMNDPNMTDEAIRARERIAEAETATYKAETDVAQAKLLLVVASTLGAVILRTMVQVVAVVGSLYLGVAVCCFMVFAVYGWWAAVRSLWRSLRRDQRGLAAARKQLADERTAATPALTGITGDDGRETPSPRPLTDHPFRQRTLAEGQLTQWRSV